MSDEQLGLLAIVSAVIVFAWCVHALWSDAHVDDFPIEDR